MKGKIYLGILGIVILSGCTASLVKTEPNDPQIKTIRMNTGSMAEDEVYKSAFERASDKACGGKAYEILERTRNPTTLKKAGFELENDGDFYWVIRCK